MIKIEESAKLCCIVSYNLYFMFLCVKIEKMYNKMKGNIGQMINFNIPPKVGKEEQYISEAIT